MTEALQQDNSSDVLSRDPRTVVKEAIDALGLPQQTVAQLHLYLWQLVLDTANPKAEIHQKKMLVIMQALIESGEKEKAGLLFNLHRSMTEFRGYGANEKASSDVPACFNPDLDIPGEGLIVVDRFALRNLPAIVNQLDEQQRKRVKVRVPKLFFAAQLDKMNDEKRQEFETAVGLLSADAFLIEDVNHCHDIDLPEDEGIAVLFSPRTLPIMPSMDGGSEEEAIKNYQEHIREIMAKTVPGGRLFINIAIVDEYEPVNARMEKGKKGDLAKISNQVTAKVASAIIEEFKQAGWILIDGKNRGSVPDYDHPKEINGLHVQKPVLIAQGEMVA